MTKGPRLLAQESPGERVALQWALTQNNLGNALKTLGGREGDTARLKDAVAAYRAALEVRTRERVPIEWALTQTGLGNALMELGKRGADTARLREAGGTDRAGVAV